MSSRKSFNTNKKSEILTNASVDDDVRNGDSDLYSDKFNALRGTTRIDGAGSLSMATRRVSMSGADLYAPRSVKRGNSFNYSDLGAGHSSTLSQNLSSIDEGAGTVNNATGTRSAAETLIAHHKSELMGKWRRRLKFLPRDVEVYRQVLDVHALVAEPREDLDT